MASFVGTKEEFKRYVGPMLRNLVQQLTKKHKMEIGKCEHCGTSENLEAAHKHGKDRGSLIDRILNNYTNNNVVTIDLANFEQHFRNEHKTIDDTILILCRTCHSKYDSLSPSDSTSNHQRGVPERTVAPPIQATQKYLAKPENKNRIFSNQEIQYRVSSAAQKLPSIELEKLCSPQHSKNLFDINFPLFVRIPKNLSADAKKMAIKDSKGANRWTWKYNGPHNLNQLLSDITSAKSQVQINTETGGP